MSDEEGPLQSDLIQSPRTDLAKRSATLVRRGIESLKRSGWKAKKVSDRGSERRSISASGKLARSYSLGKEHGKEHVIQVFTIHGVEPVFFLSAPAAFSFYDREGRIWRTTEGHIAEDAVSFSWSPCGAYLVTGSGNHERALRVFDVRAKRYLWCFGQHGDNLYNIAWSSSGEYIASASTAYDPHLKLWRCSWDQDLFGKVLQKIELVSEATSIQGFPRQSWDKDEQHWSGLYGFEALAFSPSSRYLAVVASTRTAGEFVVIFQLPALIEMARVQAPGEITDLAWGPDEATLLFSSNSSIYRTLVNDDKTDIKTPQLASHDLNLNDRTQNSTTLPYDLCSCHPHAKMVAFAEGRFVTAQGYVGGRISVRTLEDLSVISEYTCSSAIRDLCWRSDGRGLFAISNDGLGIQYQLESP